MDGLTGKGTIEIPVHLALRPANPEALKMVQQVFLEEFTAACQDIGLHVAERIKQNMRQQGKGQGLWNTGALINSITWSLIAATVTSIGVSVGTNLTYGKYKEFGTEPHFVPFHMAKSLYDEAVGWGWKKVNKKTKKYAALQAKPAGKAVSEGPAGMKLITGKHKTYLSTPEHAERLWLTPPGGGKPAWGLFVSGEKQPFMFPGWIQSLEWVENRLVLAGNRAGARLSGGGQS